MQIRTTPTVIGISGAAGAGKSTFAALLGERVDLLTIPFATHIKEFAGKVFLFTEDQLWGPTSARNAPDHRYTLTDSSSVVRGAHPQDLVALVNRHKALVRYMAAKHDFIEMVRDAAAVPAPQLAQTDLGMPTHTRPARATVERLLDVTIAQIFGGDVITPRLVLQLLGTEFGRAVDQDLWVKLWKDRAQKALDSGVSVAAPDMRFTNEARAVRDLGGQNADITRSGTASAGVVGHSSEETRKSPEFQALTTDHVANDGTLGEFAAQVAAFAQTLALPAQPRNGLVELPVTFTIADATATGTSLRLAEGVHLVADPNVITSSTIETEIEIVVNDGHDLVIGNGG